MSLFFVEDERARSILKHTLNRFFALVPTQATALASIIPVGGYCETAKMAINSRSQVFSRSKVFAIVDQDAFEDLEHKPKFRQLLESHSDIIFGMGFTPEVFLIEQIENAENGLKNKIRRRFHSECSQIIASHEYQACNSHNHRKLAKDRYDVVLSFLSSASGDSLEIVNDALIHIIVEELGLGRIQSLWGPIIGR